MHKINNMSHKITTTTPITNLPCCLPPCFFLSFLTETLNWKLWLLLLLVVNCGFSCCCLLFDGSKFNVYSPLSCFSLCGWNHFFVIFIGFDELQGKCLLATLLIVIYLCCFFSCSHPFPLHFVPKFTIAVSIGGNLSFLLCLCGRPSRQTKYLVLSTVVRAPLVVLVSAANRYSTVILVEYSRLHCRTSK